MYFRVTKAGVPTPVAADRIARHMGVHPHEIGVAGLKDAQAVTTHLMSLEFADATRLERFRNDQVKVEVVAFHGNKLRPGHLAGNRFRIRARGVGARQLDAARKILDVLGRRGVPNYFGEQRFGLRGDTGLLGETMVKNDLESFVALFLGRSRAGDPPDCKGARDAFDAGFLNRAMQCWPRHYVNQRKALAAYKRRRSPAAALAAVDKRMKRLYVSAFQSELFNDVLARRVEMVGEDGLRGTTDRVLAGDMAQKTGSDVCFYVQDPAVEQPRADRFEISPTGPIVGYRASLAQGLPGEIECRALASRGVAPESFRRAGALRVKGARRALRFRLEEPALAAGRDGHGEYLEMTFSAPSGCYATVVLREIMKSPEQPEGEEAAGD